MKFFEGCRPEVYWHGAKLRRDKKTGKRLWGITLIVTLKPELVSKCAELVEQAYIYLLTLDNMAEDVSLSAIAEYMTASFFPVFDAVKPQLVLENVDLAGLRLTRDGEVAELWFQFEAENNHTLHAFIKEFAFTRVWAEFRPRQMDLAAMQPVADAAIDKKKRS